MPDRTVEVQTSLGPGRLHLAGEPGGLWLLLGHGAGGGIDALDLAHLAAAIPASGIGVARYEQPWRVAGKKVAPAPARLDEGWIPAVQVLQDQAAIDQLVVGGRSAGARVACRTATASGAAGVLCCAFPLHPPGRLEKSRLPELLGAGVPTVVVQGSRDSFGTDQELREAVTGSDVRVLTAPGGDHAMKTPARTYWGPIGQALSDAVAELRGRIGD
ncbi:alpha/beta family hydrolase [Naumannella halotolerans]|uniref:KANL3/Tex30 alpha/beta hydrolase-like domain-containing protein n=1 Tax=Naumannella halotolerans TaxID=993414 RepID=A0A4R7J862_9ACTN|nr:alpha/beta family hydrolase [Naumannella halotolerans]TDT33670.1 hypothetical protein CLV29_1295 [Naumannella halotolerans]